MLYGCYWMAVSARGNPRRAGICGCRCGAIVVTTIASTEQRKVDERQMRGR